MHREDAGPQPPPSRAERRALSPDATANATHQIRYMKPLLDDKFVAYMGYAIQTEREAIEERGLNPDREPSRWLQVLGVIQKGVMAELQKSVHKDVEVCAWFRLRSK